jgi:hypothetical protein
VHPHIPDQANGQGAFHHQPFDVQMQGEAHHALLVLKLREVLVPMLKAMSWLFFGSNIFPGPFQVKSCFAVASNYQRPLPLLS